MKKLLLIFCLTIAASQSFANKIDTLSSGNIKGFLTPLVDKFLYKQADEKWDVVSWQKLDLNQDGLTDLIAIEVPKGSYEKFNFVVIDKGNDNFQLNNICYHFASGKESIETIKVDNKSMIVFRGFKYKLLTNGTDRKPVPCTDTLIYKFDGFVEYKKRSPRSKIDSITYSITWGLGWATKEPPPNTNPDQNLVIDTKGKAVYSNIRSSNTYIFSNKSRPPRHPKTDQGTFKSVIKKDDLAEIYDLISYLDIKKLDNWYQVNWSDDTNHYISVKFKDGSTKSISDYGGSGTFGLKLLYRKLFALRDSQDWK